MLRRRVSAWHWTHDRADRVSGDNRPLQKLTDLTKCPTTVRNHRALSRAKKFRDGFDDPVAISPGEGCQVLLRGLRAKARALKARSQGAEHAPSFQTQAFQDRFGVCGGPQDRSDNRVGFFQIERQPVSACGA